MKQELTWAARILGAAMVLLVAVFWVGEGPPPLLGLRGLEAVQMAAFIAAILGLAAAWKWPLYGALATLVGWAAFQAVEITTNNHIVTGWPYMVILAAGLLFGISGLMRAPKA